MPNDLVLSELDGPVAVLTLNRPKQFNAVSLEVMETLTTLLEKHDADPNVRCMVIAGAGDKAFSSGADIGDMVEASMVEMVRRNQFIRWERIKRITKPIIAAVQGYCVGGGNELAMACDIIIASEDAVFSQPEINIGVIPGAGGTQRLTRALGKYKAMEMVLTGRMLTAQEAYIAGLCTRVVAKEACVREAVRLGKEIATKPAVAVRFGKESVVKAQETSLQEGLEYERKLFYMLFATEDQKEGMRAFMQKRKPEFKGE